MLCLWSDFGEEHRHNITAVLKEWKQLKFVIWDEMRLSVFKRKTKYTKLNLKLKVIFTCVIRIHFLVYQLSFVSFMSSIVQFTFIVSISISPCIKINADAVGLHITQVFTEPGNCYFHGASCVVYEAFPVKCFLRPELQIGLRCRRLWNENNKHIKRNIIAYDDMMRITKNVISDIFSSCVLFLACRKCLRTSLCKNQTSWEMKIFNPPSNFACS